VILKLSEYTKDPNFVPERVAQYSVACQSFCQWVLALEHYHKVHKRVLPKQVQYDKVSSQLQVLLAQLQDKEQQLTEVHRRAGVGGADGKWDWGWFFFTKRIRANQYYNLSFTEVHIIQHAVITVYLYEQATVYSIDLRSLHFTHCSNRCKFTHK